MFSQWWLSILRQLCVIIKRHAQINWYFQCSVVSLTLCKEYLNTAAFRISFLFLIKSWTFWYIDCLPKSLYKKSYALQKMVRFFWPTLYIYFLSLDVTVVCRWIPRRTRRRGSAGTSRWERCDGKTRTTRSSRQQRSRWCPWGKVHLEFYCWPRFGRSGTLLGP